MWARYCVGCHIIDGDGGKDGPELSKAGEKHDVETLKTWIIDPEAVEPAGARCRRSAIACRRNSSTRSRRYLASRK